MNPEPTTPATGENRFKGVARHPMVAAEEALERQERRRVSDIKEPVAVATGEGQKGRLFFVFDVESVGLHGDGFAVAGGVYCDNGSALREFQFSCPTLECEGTQADREWVFANCPQLAITHRTPKAMRQGFRKQWILAKNEGALMAADCPWPVEAKFLEACIEDDKIARNWEGPYPLIDIGSVLLGGGMDPLGKYSRTASELPEHDPLADARQSARLLATALARRASPQPEATARLQKRLDDEFGWMVKLLDFVKGNGDLLPSLWTVEEYLSEHLRVLSSPQTDFSRETGKEGDATCKAQDLNTNPTSTANAIFAGNAAPSKFDPAWLAAAQTDEEIAAAAAIECIEFMRTYGSRRLIRDSEIAKFILSAIKKAKEQK